MRNTLKVETLIEIWGLKILAVHPNEINNPELLLRIDKYCRFVFVCKCILALPFGRNNLGPNAKGCLGQALEVGLATTLMGII